MFKTVSGNPKIKVGQTVLRTTRVLQNVPADSLRSFQTCISVVGKVSGFDVFCFSAVCLDFGAIDITDGAHLSLDFGQK